jgi:hypothetical protein
MPKHAHPRAKVNKTNKKQAQEIAPFFVDFAVNSEE